MIVEEQEEKSKKRVEQQRAYRQRKSQHMTTKERRMQGTQNLERQRMCRQRRQYLTNIHVLTYAYPNEEENTMKIRTLEGIYTRAQHVILFEKNDVGNAEEVQIQEVRTTNMVRDEEIQTVDNVSIPFEEMKIRHRIFHDRID